MNVKDGVLSGDNVTFIESSNKDKGMHPLYLLIHYTAGPTLDGAVSWFEDPDSDVSAHLVIGRDGKTVQMVRFNERAWHAGLSSWGELTAMNKYSIGIELVNSGKLHKTEGGKWLNWSSKEVSSDEVIVATHKNESHSAGWQTYTSEQLERLVEVGRTLHATYHFSDVLGHDDVAPKRKVDPGPAFPMTSVRSRILGNV